MNIIDLINEKTLQMVYSITHFVIIVVLMIIYPIYKKKYFSTLILGYLLSSIAIAMILMRSALPVFWSVVVGNVMIFSGTCILMMGYQEMINKKVNKRLLLGLIISFTCIHIYFTYLNPVISARIISYSVFNLLVYSIQIFIFLRVIAKKFDVIFAILTFSFFIHISTSLLRLINAIGNENIEVLFRGAVVFKLFLIGSLVASLTQIISVMTYNTRDLIE